MDTTLPIHAIERDIHNALRTGNRLVISAPTGSGKTTQVPQLLLASRPNERIVILQPRRLAARMMACRVAAEMNTPVGQTVGYRTRHDSQAGPRTQVLFVTEGLFLRQLLSDPQLNGIGTVILDEFHERSVAADTALALVKALQQTHRPDLRLVVMSATLEVQRLCEFLACPAAEAAGRQFPIAIQYLAQTSVRDCWELAGEALDHVLAVDRDGDVLIFMPGIFEIRRTIETCRQLLGSAAANVAFLPLYAEMPAREQDAVLAPSPQRKVIVATNVAETSITLPGVRHVIDSGLARINRFDPRRGINVLLVEPINRASAQQRAGRAGRTAPGTCTRLWTENEDRKRPAAGTPEIGRVDLAETLLRLLAMGLEKPGQLEWLNPPQEAAINQAAAVLAMLGAIDAAGRISALGRSMASLPMHPRLSRLLAAAAERGCLKRAMLWAALISERDIVIRDRWSKTVEAVAGDEVVDSAMPSDLAVLERAYARAAKSGFDWRACEALGLHVQACRQVERTAKLYEQACRDAGLNAARAGHRGDELAELLKSLLTAFPDHVALRRGADRSCAMAGPKRGELDRGSVTNSAPTGSVILASDIREIAAGGEGRVILSDASAIESSWLQEVHPDRLTRQTLTVWNAPKQAVEQVERLSFSGLVLEEKPRGEVDPNQAAAILAEQIAAGALKLDQWDEQVEQWLQRTRCVAQWFPERKLLAYEPDDLRVIFQEICAGAARYNQVKDRPCLPAVRDALSWEDQRFVEQMAPDRIALPGGWRMKVTYQQGSPPRGRAKIQDLYGLTRSPMVAAGRQTVVVEILAPNFRPVQATDDLAGFWKNLYPVVKKELARKYPRHEWR